MVQYSINSWWIWAKVWVAGGIFCMAISLQAQAPVPGKAAPGAAQEQEDYLGILHAGPGGPAFEVVSIRPSAPHAEMRFSGVTMKQDRLEIMGTSIKDLIKFAYNVENDEQFSGGPAWIRTEKFDLIAKSEDAELSGLSAPALHRNMMLMVQVLLEQRLHLKVSFPRKSLPTFALTVPEKGLKCASAQAEPEGSAPPPPPLAGLPQETGGAASHDPEMHWEAKQLPFRLIVSWLRKQPEIGGRPLLDRTGLSGLYSCKISWAPEGADYGGPSLFAALRQQMGLALVAQRVPIETVAVELVEFPSEN